MTLHPRKVLGIPATDTLPCFPAGLSPISTWMLRVRIVGLLTISTPVATTFRPSCEKGRQSSVQEYSPFRRGLSGSLAALFRCRWLIAIPSCEAVRAVCVVLECQKNRKGWGAISIKRFSALTVKACGDTIDTHSTSCPIPLARNARCCGWHRAVNPNLPP